MSSSESTWFHRFCRRWLPWLLIECPLKNLHYRWRKTCECGRGYSCGGHHGSDYVHVGKGWWHRVGTEIAIRNVEAPHPYSCVHHGGSPRGEELNEIYGYTCPKCIWSWRDFAENLASFPAEDPEEELSEDVV